MTADRYPPHSSYENSGITSCPIRPAHWSITRLKFISELNPSKSEVRHLDPMATVTFLPMEAIGENGELDVSQERPLQEVRNGYTFLAEGDVCIAKITPCFENGKGAIISGTKNGVAFATTEVIPFRCKRSMDAGFLYYLLKSAPFKPDAEASMYGAGGQKRVADSFAGNYSAVLPPPAERSQIAKFLDYETAKIDALIEKQQQLIALLKEKRQAVISHAVTKGLNPDVPMRDSGVEWLGEVPAHWTVVRLKRTCEIQSGMPKGKPASDTTVDMPMLRVANVQDGWLNLDDVHQIPVERSQVARYLLRSGDVLMNEGGDRDKLGRGTIWRDEVPNCIHQNHVFAIRPLSIEPEWLDAVTRADYAKFHFYLVAKQSTNLASISSSNIKETPLAVPPMEERKAILDHIDLMTAKTSTTIELADRQNVLLQERRTALISAAVTGKIDVRGWKPPETETQEEVA